MVKKKAHKKPRKMWMLVPEKKPKPTVPEATKQRVMEEANKLIETVIKPQRIEPPPTDNDFNYLVDVYGKWYRCYFYFVAKYNCPSPRAMVPSFEHNYVRLEYVDEDQYNFAYRRYNDQWIETHPDCSLAECLNIASSYPP